MNNFEIIILAIALVFSSWSTYMNAGNAFAAEPFIRKTQYTAIMFVIQFLMAGSGIWIGFKVSSAEVRVNMLISLSLMLIFGLKVLFTGIRTQTPEKSYNFTDHKDTLFAALTEGITPLFIGLSIGLLSVNPYFHWFLIEAFLFTGILAGFILDSRMKNNMLKLSLEPIGGLLLLAAAIKLTINLIGF